MFKLANKKQFNLSIIFSTTLFLAGFDTSASEQSTACHHAVPIELDTTFRGHSGIASESHFFQLYAPTAGWLKLDVMTPVASGTAARIEFFGPSCDRESAIRTAAVIDRTATHSLIALRKAGTHYLRVRAHDPAQPLGDYRLSVHFVALEPLRHTASGRAKSEEVEVDPFPEGFADNGWNKSEEVEVDPFPEGFADNGWNKSEEVEVDPFPEGFADNGWNKSEEVEVDPFPEGFADNGWNKSEEVEVDPFPEGFADIKGTDWTEACRRTTDDDHGDGFPCATPLILDRGHHGAIDNDWGDDEDVFEISLTRPSTVRIEIRGQTLEAADLALHDQRGQRLADAPTDPADDLRLVRWLEPGRYFLRLAGRYGSEGTYEVSLESLDW